MAREQSNTTPSKLPPNSSGGRATQRPRKSANRLVLGSVGTVLGTVLRRTIYLILILLLLAGLVLAALLGTATGRAWTAQQGIMMVNQYSDWYIQARNVRSPGLTKWEIGHLRVFPPGLDQAAVQIEELSVGFPLRQWEVAYTIDRLTAARVTVDLERFRVMTPATPDPDEEPQDLPPEALPTPGFGVWLDHLEIADLQISDQEGGAPLRGRLVGSLAWSGSSNLPVFDLDWRQHNHQPLIQLSGQPSNDGTLWQLRAETQLPPNTWAHNLTQWPADSPLEAMVRLDANLADQTFLLRDSALPWQGHQVRLTGLINGENDGSWGLTNAELTIDDRVSTLAGRYAPGDSFVEGQLDIPLTLVQPFLPETVRHNTVRPGDALNARIQWSQTAPWNLTAELTTHWFDHTLQSTFNAEGTATQVADLSANLSLGSSTMSASGNWNVSTHQGTVHLLSELSPDVAEPFFADPVFGGAQVQGTVIGQGRTDDGALAMPYWAGRVSAQGLLDTDSALASVPWHASASTGVQYPEARWRNLTLDLDTLGENARLLSDGEINLDDMTLAADWVMDELPIASIMQAFGVWHDDLTAVVSGRGAVSGPVNNPTGEAQLDAYGQFMGQAWEADVVAPVLSMQQILVESATGQWRESRFSAALSLRPDLDSPWEIWPVQADIAPVEFALSDVRSLVDAWPEALSEGQVITSLSARGVLGDPDLMAQARINARYMDENLTGSLNWQADNLQADFNWQDRVLRVNGQGRPWATGTWAIEAERLQTTDLEPWVTIPEALIEANLTHTLQLNIRGGVPTGQAELTTEHIGSWNGQPLTGDVAATAHWDNTELQEWVLSNMALTWGGATLSATAHSLESDIMPAAFDVVLGAFPVHLLLPIPDFSALVSGNASLDANWPSWALNVDMDVQGQQEGQLIRGDVIGRVQGDDSNLIQADLSALDIRVGDSTSITGSGGLDNDLWNLTIDWEGLSWVPPQSWPLPAQAWTGDGSMQLAGASDDPEIQARTEWRTNWSTIDQNEELTLTLSAQVITTDDALTLTTGLRRPGKDLVVAGAELPRLPLRERLETDWTTWPINAFWDIDLSPEEALYWLGRDQLQVSGTLLGHGTLTGPMGTPDMTGLLTWENGLLRIPQINVELDQIFVELAAENTTRLDIVGEARAGAGSLDLAGNITVQEGTITPDLNLNIRRAAVVQRPDVQSLASGALTLTGSWPETLLAGELRLTDLTVNLNRLNGASVPQLEVHNEQSDSNGALNGGLPLMIDIGISTDGLAAIRGNGLDARLSGQLRLGGTVGDIQSDGALTIESGTFNLLTRQFRLQEGQVRLVEEAIDLQLTAVHQRQDVLIEASLSGNAERLDLQLRSEPALPEDEIVAQLLFGKSVQNMTPWQALQLASAINQLRGGDSLDLLMVTRDTLGLDTLEIDAAEDEGSPATLRVGRYLNSRVYLELDTELGDDRDWQGSVEVELTPNLNLETFTGSGGRSGGLELRWRRDY